MTGIGAGLISSARILGFARLPEIRQVAAQDEHVRDVRDLAEHLAVRGGVVLLTWRSPMRRNPQLAIVAIFSSRFPTASREPH